MLTDHMKRFFIYFVLFASLAPSAAAQSADPGSAGIALSPARFELEMEPGAETTVVLTLDHRGTGDASKAARILASLNDWTITRDGRVEYFPANTQKNSASPWLIYTPGEAAVAPGTLHQIRVTVSVPYDAQPGDHLAALIIEQRPETLKPSPNSRQVVVKYRMASVFYIKVKNLVRKGDIGDLLAEADADGIHITPTLKNDGNSMVRPIGSIQVLNEKNNVVAELTSTEMLPVLAGAETAQRLSMGNRLPAGAYTVKYRVDFQNGSASVEGITDLVVKPTVRDTASAKLSPGKP
jgi:hypothetical protein